MPNPMAGVRSKSSGSVHSMSSDSMKLTELALPRNLLEAKDSTLFTFHHILEKFVSSNDQTLFLPKYLTPQQKNYLLTVVQCMGLKIRFGRSEEAYVTKTRSTFPFVRMLVLAQESQQRMESLVNILGRETVKKFQRLQAQRVSSVFRPVASLTCGSPQIPAEAKSNLLRAHRESLPIFKYRQEILETIQRNKYTIVKGPIGCGKSTQVPQYIIENAAASKSPIRVLVCSPRRSVVIATSDRVALERGEKVGHTVGYQVRLESCYSPVETLVHFVSSSVLLQALATPGCHLMDTCTHIILDELQCRERHQDFLMNCLQDISSTKEHLKIILMCENVPYMDFLRDYFCLSGGGGGGGSEIVVSHTATTTEGPPPLVMVYNLEDILRFCWNTNNGDNTHYMHTFERRTDEEFVQH